MRTATTLEDWRSALKWLVSVNQMFSPGDQVRVKPDHVYTSPDDLPNTIHTVEKSFYAELFECNHVTLTGISGSWWEGRFELVQPADAFTLGAIND